MKPNPVGWFEIHVRDTERARRFYETVFEVKLEKLPATELEMWTFPMSPEQIGEYGFYALAVDPDGTTIGLHSRL